ncbi:hypothetical protein [Bradyrhizobium sp. Tv2a-2]|uniref:hypothetical protein n=1 Tax=Bradyrhizobium sp. Tv2a-2 TaxID=113395 RepID=UPI0012EB40D4|nr:hypothetical protein [Bradyrhizobium sp. Tv2a-2]
MLTVKVIALFLGAGMPVSVFAGEFGPQSASRHHRVSLIETTLLANSLSLVGRIEMFRCAFLAFAIFAFSSIALTPASAAVAKPTIRADARNHGIRWTPELRTPAQSNRPVNDPFACMLLG